MEQTMIEYQFIIDYLILKFDRKKLHTVIWFQEFQYNTNDLYTLIWFQVIIPVWH